MKPDESYNFKKPYENNLITSFIKQTKLYHKRTAKELKIKVTYQIFWDFHINQILLC